MKRLLALVAVATAAAVLVARRRGSTAPRPHADGTWELADDPATAATP